MKYVHKPTIVEAFQYTARSETSKLVDFLQGRAQVDAVEGSEDSLFIRHAGGNHCIVPGDFVFVRETGLVDYLPKATFLSRYEQAKK